MGRTASGSGGQPPARSLKGLNVLVTGANGGFGVALVDHLLASGAAKVYACARDPAKLASAWGSDPRIVRLELDVTRPDQIKAAADACPELDLFVSNAGVTCIGPVAEFDIAVARAVMEVNYFGPLLLTQALAATLTARKGGILYILSMASMVPPGPAPIYSASKSACAMMGQGVQNEMAQAGVHVALCFPGYVDTAMSRSFKSRKAPPDQVAQAALDGWAAGARHIFPDLFSQLVLDFMRRDGARILTEPQAMRKDMALAYDALPTDALPTETRPG